MRVAVDRERCQGNGVCARKAPQVFELATDGSLLLLQDQPPAELHRSVRDAAWRCPTQAITVQD
ncbi:MAG: ferredoxin [Acidimicrobiales bacterium]